MFWQGNDRHSTNLVDQIHKRAEGGRMKQEKAKDQTNLFREEAYPLYLGYSSQGLIRKWSETITKLFGFPD
jgi:hypothetical protein